MPDQPQELQLPHLEAIEDLNKEGYSVGDLPKETKNKIMGVRLTLGRYNKSPNDNDLKNLVTTSSDIAKEVDAFIEAQAAAKIQKEQEEIQRKAAEDKAKKEQSAAAKQKEIDDKAKAAQANKDAELQQKAKAEQDKKDAEAKAKADAEAAEKAKSAQIPPATPTPDPAPPTPPATEPYSLRKHLLGF